MPNTNISTSIYDNSNDKIVICSFKITAFFNAIDHSVIEVNDKHLLFTLQKYYC